MSNKEITHKELDGAVKNAAKDIGVQTTGNDCPMKGRMCQCNSKERCHHNKETKAEASLHPQSQCKLEDMIDSSWVDRFSVVVKSLSIDKDIVARLANFMHYEMMSMKKKSFKIGYDVARDEIKVMGRVHPEMSAIDILKKVGINLYD